MKRQKRSKDRPENKDRFGVLGFRFGFSVVPSFRILGDFPSFRLLGIGGISRRSVIPSYRIWGYFPPFLDSAIPLFRLSVIPAFRVLQ